MASVPFRPLLSRSPLSSPPMESELLLSSEGVPPDEAGAIRKRRDDAPERGLKPDRLFLFFVFSPSEPAPSTLCFFSFFHQRKTRRRKNRRSSLRSLLLLPLLPRSQHTRERALESFRRPRSSPGPKGKKQRRRSLRGSPFFSRSSPAPLRRSPEEGWPLPWTWGAPRRPPLPVLASPGTTACTPSRFSCQFETRRASKEARFQLRRRRRRWNRCSPSSKNPSKNIQ